MPGHGTKAHAIRIDDDLWDACLAKAARTGQSVSDVVRTRLVAWIDELDAGFYIVSETHPGERVYAGTDKAAARVRLMHMQAARPFHRYHIEEVS